MRVMVNRLLFWRARVVRLLLIWILSLWFVVLLAFVSLILSLVLSLLLLLLWWVGRGR